MNAVTLILKSTRHPVREQLAWFIPGVRAEDWLETLRLLCINENAPLLIVPRSTSDPSPAGVVVPSFPGPISTPPANVIAYGKIAEKIFLPVRSELFPPVLDEEWPSLLDPEIVAYVWHPASGLIACERYDFAQIADLIRPLEVAEPRWDSAEPDLYLNSRIHSIGPLEPPTMEEVYQQMADGIGARAQEIAPSSSSMTASVQKMLGKMSAALTGMFKGKERSPSQQKDQKNKPGGLSKIGSGIGQAAGMAARIAGMIPSLGLLPLAYLAHKIAQLAPPTASQKTWVNHMQDWSQNVLKNIAEVTDARRRAVEKLMKMLKDDPDHGLKFAIPTAQGTQPGIDSGSSSLMPSLIEFSLAGLFGASGFGDVWDLPMDLSVRLYERYRELALREIQLQRYRRAAYIYAHLLGDFSLAARTLEQGGFFGEAAVIYRDKLSNPQEAARCYERAGQFQEAIELYLKLENHERVGELYEKLEEPDLAREYYEQAVKVSLQKEDRINAARLEEERLHDPSRALTTLQSGWPYSVQANRCLDEGFNLMSRNFWHDDIRDYLLKIQDEPFPQKLAESLEILVRHANHCTEGNLRDQFEDTARVIAARELMIPQQQQNARLVGVLENLVPHDKLHSRDCKRYREANRQKPSVKRLVPLRAARNPRTFQTNAPRLVMKSSLDSSVNWHTALTIENGFIAAGDTSQKLSIARADWNTPRKFQSVSWSSHMLRDAPVFITYVERNKELAVFPLGGPPLTQKILPATDKFPQLSVETPGWLPDDAIGLTYHKGRSTCWVLRRDLSLVCMDHHGAILSDRSLISELPDTGEVPMFVPVPMAVRRERVYFGLNDQLCIWNSPKSQMQIIELDQMIRGIVASAEQTFPRIALMHEFGGSMYWPEEVSGISASLENPVATFLRDGRLVVRTSERWQIYQKEDDILGLLLDAKASLPAQPVALLANDSHNQIMVLLRNGDLFIHEIPVMSHH